MRVLFKKISNVKEQPVLSSFFNPISHFSEEVREPSSAGVGREPRFTRCCGFNKNRDKRVTHAEEFGKELQDLSGCVVNISPVSGRHAGWTILRGTVVEEVGEVFGCPRWAAETLVEGRSKHGVRQQRLDAKEMNVWGHYFRLMMDQSLLGYFILPWKWSGSLTCGKTTFMTRMCWCMQIDSLNLYECKHKHTQNSSTQPREMQQMLISSFLLLSWQNHLPKYPSATSGHESNH